KPAPPRTAPGAVPGTAEARRGGNGGNGNGSGTGTVNGTGTGIESQASTTEMDGTKTTDARTVRERTPGQSPGPMQKRGRGDGKTEGQSRSGDRSLYDGGSPSANRLGPAKAMRARDVSRPSNW
ncbi:MAG: hypothetical protein HOV87_07065, partial [Catenulispora sp.]|nr:hypothetical protein [Catenulispora sp.]